MPTVIIDTNVFVADYLLRGAPWRLLSEAADHLDFTVAIPAVVLDEAVWKYTQQVAEHLKAQQKATDALDKLAVNQRGSQAAAPITAAYDTLVREQLDGHFGWDWQLIPYPDVSHRILVNRCMARMPPLSAKESFGDGYRDCLVWLSILASSAKHPDVLFVSNDSAYYDGSDELRALLKEEFVSAGGKSITASRTLRALADTEIRPRLKNLNEVRIALESGSHKTLDVQRIVAGGVEHIVHEDRDGYTDMLFGVNAPGLIARLIRLHPVEHVAVTEARAFSDGDLLVRVKVGLLAEFEIEADWESYLHVPGVADIMDAKEPFTVKYGYLNRSIEIEFEFVADPSTGRVFDLSVLSMTS